MATQQPLTFAATAAGATALYRADISVQDQAGNRSSTVTRTYVYDGVVPVLNSPSIPASLIGNASPVFSINVADNVGVVWGWGALQYGIFQYLYYMSPIGTDMNLPLATNTTGSFTATGFMRCLGGNKPSFAQFGVVDQGGLIASTTTAIPAASVQNCNSPGDVTYNTLNEASGNPSSVSRSSGTTVLRLTLEAPLGVLPNPYPRVEFWRSDGTWFYGIGGATATLTVTPTLRIWTYSLTWDPPNDLPLGTATLEAVLVDSDGDGAARMFTVNITP